MEEIIKIENVSLKYRKPTEKYNNLKEVVINALKGKLKYSDFWVLNDINLTVKRGESLALIGVNGAGKSTLMKLIAGIIQPTKGKVSINGTIAPLISTGAGFDYNATAKENVYLNGAFLGYSEREMQEKYEEIVKFAELEGFMNTPLKNFSSGMVSRLAFSIAVDSIPDILLVDEVLSVGDETFRRKCMAKINKMLQRGTTLVFVSHSMGQVKSLCKKAVWIKDHKIEKYGDCEEVCSAYEQFCKSKK